ncbi:hypothetical protein BpHYR1_018983 [Brachionus plicatilis]|uniref:Uncharacterized protein n=1 Tax=Brachionus plicatilis TaxID=10195 RepID=A0A3M7PIG4_BRAPC|nr:hypothetical protein BpHYR1_018983 [Brachionus plicatilis]
MALEKSSHNYNHVIALCHMKELAMNIQLEKKRRPCCPKTTTNALTRQPNESHNVNDLRISVDEESD